MMLALQNKFLASKSATFKYLAALIFSLLCSCGGGTTGTGGSGADEFSGKIFDVNGNPVSSALITLGETGDNSLSDANGDFAIESHIEASIVTLFVQSGANEATTQIDQIPAGPQQVDLELELDRNKNTVEVKQKTVQPRATPTPKHKPATTPLPANNAEPTAVPVLTATSEPTALPTEIPQTPTVLATTTPTVTVTATPTVQVDLKTFFVGTLVSSDPALLVDARIGVAGKGVKPVLADGSFQFHEIASDSNNTLLIRVGDMSARVQVGGISTNTRRVNLRLRVEGGAKGNLKLGVEFAEILDRADASDM